MIKKFLLTAFCIFLISSCNQLKDIPHPTNSATRLVNERRSYTKINEPNVKNIDFINGFRELKLDTNMDSLYLEDWQSKEISPDILYFEKDIIVTMQDKNYDCIFYLAFFKKKLIMIDVNFNDILNSGGRKFLSEDEANYEIIEPDIMALYLSTFGKGKSYILKDRVILDLYNDTWTKISYEIPNVDFEGNLFEIIEHRVNDYKDMAVEMNYKYANTPNTSISTILKNQKLVEYDTSKNGLKLLLTNKFVINEKDGGSLFFTYSIENINFKIKIYKKEFIHEYLRTKEQQESSNKIRLEAIYKKRKKKRDSINTNKSASEL